MAPALVLHDHAQDVWQGFDAGEAADATARVGLGRDWDVAFENYRARLNRVFDVGSDELYKPQISADKR